MSSEFDTCQTLNELYQIKGTQDRENLINWDPTHMIQHSPDLIPHILLFYVAFESDLPIRLKFLRLSQTIPHEYQLHFNQLQRDYSVETQTQKSQLKFHSL